MTWKEKLGVHAMQNKWLNKRVRRAPIELKAKRKSLIPSEFFAKRR